jgi:hypothetical protein
MSGAILLVLRFLMAISLYAFVGWALFAMWQDVRRYSRELQTYRLPRLVLNRQLQEGLRPYRFDIPDVVVGRDPVCDCILEDSTVSARHTRLYYRQGQWWVEDLLSTNGTFLNGEAIKTPVVLTAGDTLRCGQVVMSVVVGEK